jgi:hypothetical protein
VRPLGQKIWTKKAARSLRSLTVQLGLPLLWTTVASFFAITIVGLPMAVWMLNRLAYVTSLYRFDG